MLVELVREMIIEYFKMHCVSKDFFSSWNLSFWLVLLLSKVICGAPSSQKMVKYIIMLHLMVCVIQGHYCFCAKHRNKTRNVKRFLSIVVKVLQIHRPFINVAVSTTFTCIPNNHAYDVCEFDDAIDVTSLDLKLNKI